MSDLMDTKKVTKTRTKAENSGEIEHNSWSLDHNDYVIVRKTNGDIVEGDKVETMSEESKEMKDGCCGSYSESDDMMDW